MEHPIHGRLGTHLLRSQACDHHDDAWRKEFYVFKWTLPDIGDAICIELRESDFPHDEQTQQVMIVPLDLLAKAVSCFHDVASFARRAGAGEVQS